MIDGKCAPHIHRIGMGGIDRRAGSCRRREANPRTEKDITALLNCKPNDGPTKYCTISNLKRDTEYNFKVVGRKGKEKTFDSRIEAAKTTFRTALTFDKNSFTQKEDELKFNGQGGLSLLEFKDLTYAPDVDAFVFERNGRLKLLLPLYVEPSKAYITMEHLSSSDASAFNNGYSPFALRLNNELVNIGSPGFHTIRESTFEIKPQKGENTLEIESLENMPIELTLEDGTKRTDYLAAHTKLWVRRITADCLFGEFYNKPEDLEVKLK
ncbi:MAG: hypothetical protein NTW67_05615 [Candidatus Woesearchaeota archaeon]|nr:hypothetical protein [Candidatus Woesearchaeota archaeon]